MTVLRKKRSAGPIGNLRLSSFDGGGHPRRRFSAGGKRRGLQILGLGVLLVTCFAVSLQAQTPAELSQARETREDTMRAYFGNKPDKSDVVELAVRTLAYYEYIYLNPEASILGETFPPRIRKAGVEYLRPLAQPGDILRLLEAPGTPGLVYALNTVRQQIVSGSKIEAPDFVDYIDQDGNYQSRVDLDSDLAAFVEPQDMALSADGSTIVVAVKGTDPRFGSMTLVESHLAIVDVGAAKRDRRIFLPHLHWPSSVVLSPDGASAYVLAAQWSEDVSSVVARMILQVDLASGEIVKQMELPFRNDTTGDLAITPDGGLLLAKDSSAIYFVDARSGTVTATLGPGGLTNSMKLAMNPLGNEAYAEGSVPGGGIGISVIDIATASVRKVIPLPDAQGGSRQDVGVLSSGRILVHQDSLSGHFSIVDRLTGDVVGGVDAGDPLFQGTIAEGP